jgi:hypothetical protein
MSLIFTSPKGGNGTTVTAAAYALLSSLRGQRTVLIDLCGDQPATVGMAEPQGPGVNDWLSEHYHGDSAALLAMGNEAIPNLLVVHCGSQFIHGEPRWAALADAISTLPYTVVVDAGVGRLPTVLHDAATKVITVSRPCYLTLRRATHLPRPVHAYVLEEPGRALTTNDVVHVLGATLEARIPYEPAIARAVDAGLFPSRVEQLLGRHIKTDDN